MAYAAVNSLMQTIDQILKSDRFHVLQWEDQLRYLQEMSAFLQSFLDRPSQTRNQEVEKVERRIKYAVREAEDVIELYVSNHLVHSAPESQAEKLDQAHHDLQAAISAVDRVVQEVKCSSAIHASTDHAAADLPRILPPRESLLVGIDDDFLQMMDRLTGYPQRLQIIPILGKGGSGKTTLARKVYEDPLINHHFDICYWVTVSQQYSFRKILESILNLNKYNDEVSDELALDLYKRLIGRRYLIVMDDIWDTGVWDDVRRYLPDDNNGSRIILTTRLPDVALYVGPSDLVHHNRSLSANESWDLLKTKVFGTHGCCPPELEEFGKMIARNCEGLPVSAVAVSGLLSEAPLTQEYWRYVSENPKDLTESEDQEQVPYLRLCYANLPPHLKACFLYMAIFPEDSGIHVSKLVQLWIAEGFLKPSSSGSLEEAAVGYFHKLVDRNLILAGRVGTSGQVKTWTIHDLVREQCKKEAQKEKFVHVFDTYDDTSPDITHGQQRLSINLGIHEDNILEIYDEVRSMSLARSFLHNEGSSAALPLYVCFRLLKILDLAEILEKFPTEILQLVNLRYLAFYCEEEIPSSISSLWNIQTLIVPRCTFSIRLSLIRKMSQLRHLQVDIELLIDSIDVEDTTSLQNFHTLSVVYGFRCTEDVVRTFPNLKKLGISYDFDGDDLSHYHLNNLARLLELETLKCFFVSKTPHLFEYLEFPRNLKRLMLSGCQIPWREMTVIGSLPNLEVLKLLNNAFEGPEWEPNEGEFLPLKYLKLDNMSLKHWRASDEHFPSLQNLVLHYCWQLEEIPSGIAEIPTLKVIELINCSESASLSAKERLEEQRDLGNNVLRVYVSKSYG